MPSQFLRHSPSLGENHIHSTILPSGISSRKLATALFGTQTGIFRQKHHIIPSHFRYSCIVGYAGSKLRSGARILTPQFVDVGNEKIISLNSIVATGFDSLYNVSIKTLDNVGRKVKEYQWVDYAGESGEELGWYETTDGWVTDVTLSPGDALWVEGSNDAQGFQSSGAVCLKDMFVQLQSGATLCGNPFPITISLDDIYAEGEDSLYNVSIKTLDNVGRKVKEYQWVDYAGESGEKLGWYETTHGWIKGAKVEAGEGLWIEGSNSKQIIAFPAPEMN